MEPKHNMKKWHILDWADLQSSRIPNTRPWLKWLVGATVIALLAGIALYDILIGWEIR